MQIFMKEVIVTGKPGRQLNVLIYKSGDLPYVVSTGLSPGPRVIGCICDKN